MKLEHIIKEKMIDDDFEYFFKTITEHNYDAIDILATSSNIIMQEC